MSPTIRISEATNATLERVKREDESFDELLARLASDEASIAIGSWDSDTADRARDAIDRSRDSLE